MAVSLGFGILFATFITLLLVPVAYLLLEVLKHFSGGMTGLEQRAASQQSQ